MSDQDEDHDELAQNRLEVSEDSYSATNVINLSVDRANEPRMMEVTQVDPELHWHLYMFFDRGMIRTIWQGSSVRVINRESIDSARKELNITPGLDPVAISYIGLYTKTEFKNTVRSDVEKISV